MSIHTKVKRKTKVMTHCFAIMPEFLPVDPVKLKYTTECSCTQTRGQHPSDWRMIFCGFITNTSKTLEKKQSIVQAYLN